MSKGELYIAQLLNKNNFQFQQEKAFEDLRDAKFRYDFYIISNKKNTSFKFPILLEFDGKQHFSQVKRYQQTRLELNKQKGYDRRKNNYALAKHIPLYRIPYWELKNISSIEDLFNEKYLVKSQFHNDYIWEEYLKERGEE